MPFLLPQSSCLEIYSQALSLLLFAIFSVKSINLI